MSRYHDNAEVSVGDGLLRYTDDYAVPDFDFFSTWGKPKGKRALDRQKRFQVSSFFCAYNDPPKAILQTTSDRRVTKEVVSCVLWLRKANPSAFGPKNCPWSRFLPLGCGQYHFTGKTWWHGRRCWSVPSRGGLGGNELDFR